MGGVVGWVRGSYDGLCWNRRVLGVVGLEMRVGLLAEVNGGYEVIKIRTGWDGFCIKVGSLTSLFFMLSFGPAKIIDWFLLLWVLMLSEMLLPCSHSHTSQLI